MNARHVPDFRFPPSAPLPTQPPLTRKQLALIVLGWSLAMAATLFLLTPAGRALLAAIWGQS